MNDLVCIQCGIKEVSGDWSLCDDCRAEREEENEQPN